MNLLFYVSACVAVIATAMVVTLRNPVHALLYLILSLLAVALVFFSLGAPFVAALEVIIYAGAIMVLFVFVIMMLNPGTEEEERYKQLLDPKAWLGPSILAGVLLVETGLTCLFRGANIWPRRCRSARNKWAWRFSARTSWEWSWRQFCCSRAGRRLSPG